EAIRTTGDMIRDRPLAEEGGKGLFTKEIEQALLAGAVELAVHSAKDMPTFLPAGLAIAAVLPREDPRDVFIGGAVKTLAELPRGARVGTASPRRAALIKRQRGDLAVVPLRGNVETRLRKLAAGEVDAIVLAPAGLQPLGSRFAGSSPSPTAARYWRRSATAPSPMPRAWAPRSRASSNFPPAPISSRRCEVMG